MPLQLITAERQVHPDGGELAVGRTGGWHGAVRVLTLRRGQNQVSA